MLDPKHNQLDYGKLLMPPPDFTLVRAIGTTYSVDLQALLAIPVAMFYSKPMETDFEKNEEPLDVFDAISKASKNVTVFCQRGKIKPPRKFSKLISFTENCVVEIKPPAAYNSFHPKCWWLWFKDQNTGETIVRFVVLSRNLSFDRCWDVGIYFEGLVSKEIQGQNKSMIEMLNYLEDTSGYRIENDLKNELERVVFIPEHPIRTWKFHAIGINEKSKNPLLSNYYRPDTLLMMSPFVDDASVQEIANKATEKSWLFSRRTEVQKLTSLSFGVLNCTYCIPDIIVNGERIESMSDDVPNVEPESLDLHAKLYISRKGNTNTWMLGSANLTQPAFGRNVECLIEIKTDDFQLSPESIMRQLVSTEKERKLFEEFTYSGEKPADPEENIEQAIRRLEFGIINCSFAGRIIPDESGKLFSYEIILDASNLEPGKDFRIYIQPFSPQLDADLGELIKASEKNIIHFKEHYKETQLSGFFVFSISYKGQWKKSFLLKAEIQLPESRTGKILSEVINSKEKFLQYLRFLLSDSGIVGDLINNVSNNKSKGEHYGNLIWAKYDIPLYEELLKAAAQNPDKLKSIDDIITKLVANEETKDVVTHELLQLWSVFKEIIK
jgi:hypothetical protein